MISIILFEVFLLAAIVIAMFVLALYKIPKPEKDASNQDHDPKLSSSIADKQIKSSKRSKINQEQLQGAEINYEPSESNFTSKQSSRNEKEQDSKRKLTIIEEDENPEVQEAHNQV